MKKLSRLTALLLALLMIITAPCFAALAAGVSLEDLDRATWDSWTETEATSDSPAISSGGNVYNTETTDSTSAPLYETSETISLSEDASAQQAVELPQYGKVTLSAAAAESYQWQLYYAAIDSWVNVTDANSAEFALTYAKICSILDASGSVQVRCVYTKGETMSTSAVAKVSVLYSSVSAETAVEETIAAEPATASAFSLRSASANDGIALANEDGTEAQTTYSIVINYVFEDNEIAADPYTASLAAGSNFGATVTFPTVMGYLPYYNNVQQNSLELNVTDIQANATYNIVYKPTNVDYTVIHYLQNVDNDNYTETARETLQGLTGTYVSTTVEGAYSNPEVANSYAGFYALLYEKPEIAADGSTLVEIYYDRYYYLMNFELDGGYGVEPIYARYGAAIGDVGTPTKAGYTFSGWSLDGTTVDSTLPEATMPVGGATYKAVWTANDTAKVTIVFWGENANDEEYSYIKSSEVNIKPGVSFTYSENGSVICGVEAHTHSAECGYTCGEEGHAHSVEGGCYQLTCTETSHNHTTDGCELICTKVTNHNHTQDCYDGAGNKVYYVILGGTQTEGYVYYSQAYNQTFIYIDGDWHSYSGAVSSGSIASTKCGEEENHSHTDACYACGKTEETHTHSVAGGCYTLTCAEEEHIHSDACGYSCGKTGHTHSSSCYLSGAGLDSTLWTFVRSDTVTVAADGSSIVNVYYDRTTFTLTYRYGNNYDTTSTITDKWGANILSRYNAIVTSAGGSMWSESTYQGPYTNYFGVMPAHNKTYYLYTSSGNVLNSMTYHLQKLDSSTEYDQVYQTQWYGQSGWDSDGYYSVTEEDFFVFEGFTINTSKSPSIGDDCKDLHFYYDRNVYDIEFYNPTDLIKKVENVPYQKELDGYDFTPGDEWIPEKYEPGSVEFAGWYLNPECSGEKYILADHTMPVGTENGATSLSLYAKWVPVTHTVQFYLDYDAMIADTEENDTELATHPARTVSHGTIIGGKDDKNGVQDPANGAYVFVGWFYLKDGVETPFDFANMPINRDMKVYAKWSSNTLKNYFIYYKYKDANGVEIEIADSTTGSALAGSTKTFDAKGGTELYAAYQAGYFPVTQSHSLTIDIENDANNTYTFWYVQKDAVPYIVRYVDENGNEITDESGNVIVPQKVVADNRKAVVTENFAVIPGYMPDAYQKRLVVTGETAAEPIRVTVDGKEVSVHPDNVITFVYVEDTTHAYYKITHYTQNTDGKTWTEYASSQAIGDIDTVYTAEPMSISGFTYDPNVAETVASGPLTQSGLELKLYYTRNSYPYEVRYLEKGTGKQLADPKTVSTAKYGQVISESAIEIANYTPVDPTSQTLNIRIEESATEAKLNIITFYYEENEATINYKIVTPDGVVAEGVSADCGSLTSGSETLKVLSGNAQGSTAEANTPTYKFVGWYSDAACTDANRVGTDATFTPTKDADAVWPETSTYYAKFELGVAPLTITKTGMINDGTTYESAIFMVVTAKGTYTVAIPNGTSVTIADLPIGSSYTITEVGSWSWRYSAQTITGEDCKIAASGTTVEIKNSNPNPCWLSDEGSKINNYNAETGKEVSSYDD